MIRFRCFCILEASNLFCTVENRRQLPAQIVFHKRKSQVILSLTTTSVEHPQDNGTSALNTHQLQVERRESHWANQVMVMLVMIWWSYDGLSVINLLTYQKKSWANYICSMCFTVYACLSGDWKTEGAWGRALKQNLFRFARSIPF